MYNIIADLHSHTVNSVHAFSTVKENIEEAKLKGLKYLASTDHYYGYHSDEKHLKNEAVSFRGISRVNNYETDFKIIPGVELNVSQDIEVPKLVRDLKWKIASCHEWYIENKTLEEIKSAIKDLAESKNITAIGHPDKFLKDYIKNDYQEFYKWLIKIAKDNNIYLEVNRSSTREDCSLKYLQYWLRLARDNGNKIYLGSDAHYYKEIGDFEKVIPILENYNYPEELILNCDEEKLKKFI